MEEQIRAYYEKVCGLFPNHHITVGCSINRYATEPSWHVGVEPKESSLCKCCGNKKDTREIFVVKPTFDAALAEVIAQAGV